ncbi:hypothetical protein VXQ47_15700 [Acinetobacter pittii]|uniref:hypothetical protein n=1 Tax=Acinetobacter pittii TaxID=48296 RepID=UPI003A84A823
MIFTKIRLKNWYSFKDATLDLSYPKKIVNNTIDYEYLEGFENIKFKRVSIISGANSSGKTSFSKALCAIRHFITFKDIPSQILEGQRSENEKVGFEIEFIAPKVRKLKELSQYSNDKEAYEEFVLKTVSDKYDHYHSLIVSFDDNHIINSPLKDLAYKFNYVSIPINKSDTIPKLREKIEIIRRGGEIKNSIILENEKAYTDISEHIQNHIVSYFFPSAANFIFSDIDSFFYKDKDGKNVIKKNILFKILKTFDTSISHISDAIDNDSKKIEGFYIHFKSGKSLYISKFGEITSNQHLLSLGTQQSIKLAKIISKLDHISGLLALTCFIDENMGNVQSEIEVAMINLIIQKMGNRSQFFYTTHNYEVLEMNLPIHSFVFLKKDEDGNSSFIQAEKEFKKNDRSILSYVKNDILGTLPKTNLIDDLIFDKE